MKSVLANFGFILQIAALLTILPIFVAFYYSEMNALIYFFTTVTVFFVSGFALNALCERKELNFKSACILITLTFFLLSLIGSIPYFLANPFQDSDVAQRLTNNYFESVSGYTTTGLTFLRDVNSLPKSILLYRSLTQWIGGLGIIFIILTFFYEGNAVEKLSKAMRFERITGTIKRSFISVLIIYSIYTVIFFAIFYALGFSDVVNSLSLIFGSFATGGFSPVEVSQLNSPFNLIVIVMMILGATTFSVHYGLFTGNFKKIFKKEFIAFLIIIIVFSVLISRFFELDISTSLFNVVGISSTTGFKTIDVPKFGSLQLIFIVLMFIGGNSFSTAGGIKTERLILTLKSIPWSIKRLITDREVRLKFENKILSDTEVLMNFLFIILGIGLVFVSAFFISLAGFEFIDSLFESTAAFSTAGVSTGITSLSLPLALKWLLMFLMILGRIEIIPFLVALSPFKVEEK